jgi:hypothetical protein
MPFLPHATKLSVTAVKRALTPGSPVGLTGCLDNFFQSARLKKIETYQL